MATVKLDPAKGVQIPNMTTTERNAVSSPETGAIIWNTTTSAVNQYNGSAWGTVGISEDTTKLPLAGGALTGAVTTNSTFDGVDIATRDAILTSTTTTAGAALPKAGGTMTGNLNIIQSTSGTGSSAVKELIYNEGAGDAALHLALSGSIDWYMGADNTDNALKLGQASWDSSPYLSIATNGQVTTGGDLIVGADVQLAVGRGISFGNMANASGMTSELLDDYEEGTWTPSTGGASWTVYFAKYVKIGRLVFLSFYLYNPTSITGGSGAINIEGMPFNYGTQSIGNASIHNANMVNTPMNINMRVYSTNRMFIEKSIDGGGGSWMAYSELSSNSHLQMTMTYMV
jgi:hypothetical protein